MARRSSKRGGASRTSTQSSTVPARRKRFIDYPRANCRGVRRWLPSWKLIVGSCVTFVLLLVGSFAAAVAFTTIPEPNEVSRSEKTIVYWNDGESELGRLGESNRISVPLQDMPKELRNATLAAEDREFYAHSGFDMMALTRAAWNEISGGSRQGGSTLTQQYAKNAFLSHEQTIARKARELILSVKLEGAESKDQILENYLNTIYFGRGAYGVETAAQAYYGKAAAQLTLSESATLAAMIQAPTTFEPETNSDGLEARLQYVLDGMVSQGWITQARANKVQLPDFKKAKTVRSSLKGTNGYLLESVNREMLRRGYSEEDLNVGGYRITTTFDKEDQAAAVQAVTSTGISSEKGLRIGLTSVENETGEVLAMYGGAEYLENQLSNSDQATGLAGSTFKPFALAAAIEDGIDLDSYWNGNSPRTIDGYTLKNEGNASYGTISLLTAMEKSVNTVFVDMANQVGTDRVEEAAIRAGVPADTIGLQADPTTVLGTSSPTTLDMAGAYATFANRGERVAPTTIKEIRRGGAVEYAHTVEPERAFEEDVADEVNYALQKVVTSGTGSTAAGLGRPAAGKTGTTDNNRSAWFVGYTPQVTTAVMLVKQNGKGDATTLYGTGGGGSVYGGSYPAQIWTSYMRAAMSGMDYEDFATGNGDSGSSYSGGYGSPSPSESQSESSSSSPSSRPSKSPKPSKVPSQSSSSAPPVAASPSSSSSAGTSKPLTVPVP
jgi:membrane peptidoglycan carboxypeptidase